MAKWGPPIARYRLRRPNRALPSLGGKYGGPGLDVWRESTAIRRSGTNITDAASSCRSASSELSADTARLSVTRCLDSQRPYGGL
jgi:hypothetical protein